MDIQPEHFLDSRDFARIGRAIRYIDEHFRSQPQLAQIAAHVGLSEFHFNRLFRRWAGVTPKQYLAFVTGTAARQALKTASVLEAAYAVGLSGPSRLHDLVITLDALTPGELKAQGASVRIHYGCSSTPFGSALIGETGRGLCHLAFIEAWEDAQMQAELRRFWPLAQLHRNDARACETANRIWGAKTPDAHYGPVRLAVAGTNFQLKVWQALLEQGAHGFTSYTKIAQAIGAVGAMRAVGNAVGANPIAYLIPCHRVLRKSLALGGYRWGEDRKRAMLAWESMQNNSQDLADGQDATDAELRRLHRR